MAVSHFSIDPDTVDILIDALTRMKRNSGSQDHKCTFMNMQACYEKEMDLSTIKAAFSKATRMRNALRELTLHADDKVQEMKYKFPMVGIRGLPNEILSRIFELTREQFSYNQGQGANETCAIRLSQVCTHFRAIALNTPRLWAYVTYDMMQVKGKLEAFLARSKDAPLMIELRGNIYESTYDSLFAKFLSAVKLHARHWIKLHIDVGCAPDIGQAFGSERLDCPILESIDVHYVGKRTDDTFCLHWNMPALKHLSSEGWYPTPFPNSHLTSLEYAWDKGEYVPKKLQVFINATHTLRDFKLRIPSKETFTPPYLPAHFPQLIKLSLLFDSAEEGRITDVMRTLHLPNLEVLSVELSRVSNMDRCIRALLPFHNKFPHLKNFRLSLQDMSYSRYPFDMSLVFSLLPALHNLTLELPNARPHFDDLVGGDANIHSGPALRSLRLIECDSVTNDFIEDALPMIRGGTGQDAFSLLEITDCENISRSSVEGMLRPEEKLLWNQGS